MTRPRRPPKAGALQAVMDDDNVGVAEGEPAVAASIGFVDNVPAVNAAEVRRCPGNTPAGKTWPGPARDKRCNAPRRACLPPAARWCRWPSPPWGRQSAARMAAKRFGAKLQIAIQLGDDVKRLIPQGRQAGVKGVHHSRAQLAAACRCAADQPDPGILGGVARQPDPAVASRLPSSTMIQRSGRRSG